MLGTSYAQSTPFFDPVSAEMVQPPLTSGSCTNCNLSDQAKWYFDKEIIASLPTPDSASVTLPKWLEKKAVINDNIPIWIASPTLIESARLNKSGKSLILGDGTQVNFETIAKIPQNQSFWNQNTTEFLKNVISVYAAK
ncbi:MAG: hypothetical protein COA34_006090 [Methylophaga sp.]|nr:hypothetical protein [Methylophaga sp.]